MLLNEEVNFKNPKNYRNTIFCALSIVYNHFLCPVSEKISNQTIKMIQQINNPLKKTMN